MAAYMHVLRVLETEFCGRSGLSTCIKHINLMTFDVEEDPFSFFNDVKAQRLRFNTMFPDERMTTMVMSAIAVCAIKRQSRAYNFHDVAA